MVSHKRRSTNIANKVGYDYLVSIGQVPGSTGTGGPGTPLQPPGGSATTIPVFWNSAKPQYFAAGSYSMALVPTVPALANAFSHASGAATGSVNNVRLLQAPPTGVIWTKSAPNSAGTVVLTMPAWLGKTAGTSGTYGSYGVLWSQ